MHKTIDQNLSFNKIIKTHIPLMESLAHESLSSNPFTKLTTTDSPSSPFSSSSTISSASTSSFECNHSLSTTSSIVKQNTLVLIPTKKLCFNYLRGCCQLSSDECPMRHPVTAAEFEEELMKLSKIDCKYGNKCTVGRCLYKHQNKELYINSSRAKRVCLAATSPQQVIRKVIDHPIEKEIISSNQVLKEISILDNPSNSNNSNNNDKKSKNIFLECFKEMQNDQLHYRNSLEFECPLTQVMPNHIKDRILNRSGLVPKIISKNENPFKIFSLMNVNCNCEGSTVFDICFQDVAHFNLLLDHIKIIAEAYQKCSIWVLVQLKLEDKLYFEKLLKVMQVSFIYCKHDNNNKSIEYAYHIEFQRN